MLEIMVVVEKIMKLMDEAEALGSQAVVNANQYK